MSQEPLVKEPAATTLNFGEERLSALAPRYDAVLCDVWGVIHNGAAVYDEAVRALESFRAHGGCVILVSNSSRLAPTVAANLDRLEFPKSAYDGLVTSGDITRDYMARRPGGAVFDVGPGDARPILDGLAVRFTSLHDADIAITSGAFEDQSLDDLDPALSDMRARDLPLLCANPDIVTELGGQRVQCSGAVGQRYAELGGDVTYAGKPTAAIYEHSLALVAELRQEAVSRRRVLAIGDSLGTDIAGGAAHGFDTLFILGGIHSAELGTPPTRESASMLCAQFGMTPTLMAHRLAW